MPAVDRMGHGQLTRMAFNGVNLLPLWQQLLERVGDGFADAGVYLDLSLIAQLAGSKDVGLAMQSEILAVHRLFRSPCSSENPRLRVLALAAAIDMGGNTPIEHLLEDADIELQTLYVVPGTKLPSPLPEHDIAIVIASDSAECRPALEEIDQLVPHWPRPILNVPRLIANLDRDKLHHLLKDIEGIDIPATVGCSRLQLTDVALGIGSVTDFGNDIAFPIIVRPRGSHAGVGLAKLDDPEAFFGYLDDRTENDFFVSRFVDYSNEDGLFRKYRIVVIDGKPFACHMAIADQWNIWYLNAGMSLSAEKRLEEATFMHTFNFGFALRHSRALTAMFERIGLDYFTVDCAENKNGDLVIFEADNTSVVHNMDSPELFPYKPPQMRLIFEAFAAMLVRRAWQDQQFAA
ncbi:hypothetical protein [Bradyrhizobium sp. SYSU BS000235]|uniref:hypothetical protein n=1 Tax=Bradyrhizobium sp. SYSU BS000235 TaxID=3411332 RepID=UPI003C7929AD